MSKKFIPSFELVFLLPFLLFDCFFLFNPLTSYSANPEKSTELTIEELRLRPVTMIKSKVGDLLRKWYAEGTAAGNVGDYYDNRDRGHSQLKVNDYPQLQQIKYSKEERNQRKDWAVQTRLLPYIVFGNSSTSADRVNGGSNVRTYYSNPGGMAFLYKQYTRNNLYIYPTHRDYSSGINGDVFPANSPYLIASKGSSGSDRKYMNAVAQTLSAFQPEVKKRLADTGFLMATIQMILRYSAVDSWEDYLTGEAHPVAGIEVNNLKMVEMAHKLQVDEIPPLVQLKVIEEDEPLNGEDFFSPGHTIKLADTPGVIARVFRGKSYWHRMVVSAEASIDLNQRNLSYYWKVFKDASHQISIRPLNEAGSVVEIRIPYHERLPSSSQEKYMSNRVEIGVFVKGGKYFSAPGFITFFSLANEARTYNDKGKILEIGYGMGRTVIQIEDWGKLFKLIAGDVQSRQAAILRSGFTKREIAFISSVAEEYTKAESEFELTQKKLEISEGDQKQELRRALRRQEKVLKKIVMEKHRKQDYSLNELVLRILHSFIEDYDFINHYQLDIQHLLGNADEVNRKSYTRELDHLNNYGIIETLPDKTIKITSIRNGTGNIKDRLTTFEGALIEKLNATALSRLFFPGIIIASFQNNFVDQRLVTPKFWRDVYHYNKADQLTGWTRYNKEGKTEFNQDGLIILKKDSMGRCMEAQTVDYRQEPPERNGKRRRAWANENPVKQVPGNEIWYYEYEDSGDGRGKVVRIEKI